MLEEVKKPQGKELLKINIKLNVFSSISEANTKIKKLI